MRENYSTESNISKFKWILTGSNARLLASTTYLGNPEGMQMKINRV